MVEHITNDSISRRSVLKTVGGLLTGAMTGATMVTGQAAALTEEESIQFEVIDINEEVIAAEVVVDDSVSMGDTEFPRDTYLGCRQQFNIEETEEGTVVALKEEYTDDSIATPVEADFRNPHDLALYFRTDDIDFSEAQAEVVQFLFVLPPVGEPDSATDTVGIPPMGEYARAVDTDTRYYPTDRRG